MSLEACWLGGNLLSCYLRAINFQIALSNDLFSFLGTKHLNGSMEIRTNLQETIMSESAGSQAEEKLSVETK